MAKDDLIVDEWGHRRCWWCGDDPLYVRYHDQEWGMPVDDDHRLFEKMCLEGFQAGLSWLTILRKRESFRSAFAGFDFARVARFDESDVDRLLADASIVRHGGKIRSVINNANRAIEMKKELGSLAGFFWSFQPTKRRLHKRRSDIEAITDDSIRMSKALKQRGWSFVGPTTCYALMQATGMVNDHLSHCASWSVVEKAQEKWVRPTSL